VGPGELAGLGQWLANAPGGVGDLATIVLGTGHGILALHLHQARRRLALHTG
jgi:hypothetical protein